MNLMFGQFALAVSSVFSIFTTLCIMITAVNCTDPPEKAGSGTWEWNGEYKFDTKITYTCGPFGNFENGTGSKYPELISTCAWNRTWVPGQLDPCVATSCQVNSLTIHCII